MTPKEYFLLLSQKNVVPNWWCSEEYFQLAGLQIEIFNGQVIVLDDDVQMFPAIILEGDNIWGDNPKGFWADFEGCSLGINFLDFEYIYDPELFKNMVGGHWATFRKNSRKFPNRILDELFYVTVQKEETKQIADLLDIWVQRFEAVQDYESLINFAFNGNNRAALFGLNGKLYGINIWDENFYYVNYRYSICGNEPFLAEYMRLLFYRDMQCCGKLVNDGGMVGNLQLKRFKEKMNPLKIREVKGI